MTTAIVQNASKHAQEQKQPVEPDVAELAAGAVAKPPALDVAKPTAADHARTGWVRRQRSVMVVAGVIVFASVGLVWKFAFAIPVIPNTLLR